MHLRLSEIGSQGDLGEAEPGRLERRLRQPVSSDSFWPEPVGTRPLGGDDPPRSIPPRPTLGAFARSHPGLNRKPSLLHHRQGFEPPQALNRHGHRRCEPACAGRDRYADLPRTSAVVQRGVSPSAVRRMVCRTPRAVPLPPLVGRNKFTNGQGVAAQAPNDRRRTMKRVAIAFLPAELARHFHLTRASPCRARNGPTYGRRTESDREGSSGRLIAIRRTSSAPTTPVGSPSSSNPAASQRLSRPIHLRNRPIRHDRARPGSRSRPDRPRTPAWAPPGANGRRSEHVGSESGGYRFSDTPTFTLDVDIRPEGDRLVNGDARCAEGYQGSLSCHTGEHGFAFESIGGENWSSP